MNQTAEEQIRLLLAGMMEQDHTEFEWMMGFVKDKSSLLEIGSRIGSGLRVMADWLKPGATICSIDYGWAVPNLPQWNTGENLQAAIALLREHGFDAHVHIGDSHDQRALDFARCHGPYDFVFIDGDHSYDGVKKDWEDYGPLGKVVGIHDVSLEEIGPATLWQEIRRKHKTTEMMRGPQFGVGIVFQEAVHSRLELDAK